MTKNFWSLLMNFLSLFFFLLSLFALLHGISANKKTQLSHYSTLGLQTCFFVSLQTLIVCPSLALWQSCQAYRLPTGCLRYKNRVGTKAIPCHFHFPFPQTHSTLSVTCIRTSSNLFAKKNCYLFCITVTHEACSHAFLPCPLSSFLSISPLGAAIKGTTSFSSQENCR
jgi:hypothetical protein